MIRTRTVSTILGTLVLGILACVPGASAQQIGLLRGRVVDAQTGDPIATAAVSIVGDGGQTLVSSSTDANGQFGLPVLNSGTFRVRAERIGYESAERGPITLSPSDTVDVELRLQPAPVLLDSILVSVRRAGRSLRTGEELIYGRLLDDDTHDPIPAGTVRLLTPAGDVVTSTMSNDDGHFWLVSPRPGSYFLEGERIGYLTARGPELMLMLGDSIGVDFYLSVHAVLLSPIVVTASRRPWGDRANLRGMEDFFERFNRFGRGGYGEFLTRDSIAQWESRVPSIGNMLMATVPGVLGTVPLSNMNMGGAILLRPGPPIHGQMPRYCIPRYYLNGAEVPYYAVGAFSPQDLEGVEVYVSPNIPSEFLSRFPCGVVVYWTRRSPGGHLAKPTLVTGALVGVIIALTFLLLR